MSSTILQEQNKQTNNKLELPLPHSPVDSPPLVPPSTTSPTVATTTATTPSPEMGVASPSTKRRLGAPETDHEVVAAKLAKINSLHSSSFNNNNNNNSKDSIIQPLNSQVEDSIASSDFLTTSILARTLLTSDPLESLKSSLEALPVPDTATSLESILRPSFLHSKIQSSSTSLSTIPDSEFATSLLCHESVLDSWSDPNQSLITEDENGKSYFNLGSADQTIVARRGSSSQALTTWRQDCSGGGGGGEIDDNASSSSCESLSSSDDLFHSGEEFEPSDDEEEEEEFSSYKQQRSTVLHLSLCKLNKFRSQQCVEPSLHRSVLICNTLRHIEQEIKSEDEVVDTSLKSRERLPSFWRASPTSNHHPHCFSASPSNSSLGSSGGGSPLLNPSANPNLNHLSSSTPEPYLSPNPYQNSTVVEMRPASYYDYNCLRPTPYHTATYEYDGDGLTSVASLDRVVGGGGVVAECDSGYGEDLYSSYYSQPQPPQQHEPPQTEVPPPPSTTTTVPKCVSPEGDSSTSTTSSVEDSSSGTGSLSPEHQQFWGQPLEPSSKECEFEGGSSPPSSGHFAHQESQCGIESRLGTSGGMSFPMSNLPMDNLISSSYSSSL